MATFHLAGYPIEITDPATLDAIEHIREGMAMMKSWHATVTFNDTSAPDFIDSTAVVVDENIKALPSPGGSA